MLHFRLTACTISRSSKIQSIDLGNLIHLKTLVLELHKEKLVVTYTGEPMYIALNEMTVPNQLFSLNTNYHY